MDSETRENRVYDRTGNSGVGPKWTGVDNVFPS